MSNVYSSLFWASRNQKSFVRPYIQIFIQRAWFRLNGPPVVIVLIRPLTQIFVSERKWGFVKISSMRWNVRWFTSKYFMYRLWLLLFFAENVWNSMIIFNQCSVYIVWVLFTVLPHGGLSMADRVDLAAIIVSNILVPYLLNQDRVPVEDLARMIKYQDSSPRNGHQVMCHIADSLAWKYCLSDDQQWFLKNDRNQHCSLHIEVALVVCCVFALDIVIFGVQFRILWCVLCLNRTDSRFVPSQWETSLQSNAVSHWLCANLESALLKITRSLQNARVGVESIHIAGAPVTVLMRRHQISQRLKKL